MTRTLYPDTYPSVPSSYQRGIHSLLGTIGNAYYELALYIWDHEDIKIWNMEVERLTFSGQDIFGFGGEVRVLVLEGHAFGTRAIFQWFDSRDDTYFSMAHFCEHNASRKRHPIWNLNYKEHSPKSGRFDWRLVGRGDSGHPDIITAMSDTKELGAPNIASSWSGFWEPKFALDDYLMYRLEYAVKAHKGEIDD